MFTRSLTSGIRQFSVSALTNNRANPRNTDPQRSASYLHPVEHKEDSPVRRSKSTKRLRFVEPRSHTNAKLNKDQNSLSDAFSGSVSFDIDDDDEIIDFETPPSHRAITRESSIGKLTRGTRYRVGLRKPLFSNCVGCY